LKRGDRTTALAHLRRRTCSPHPPRVRIAAGTCRLARDSDILVDQILAWDNELFGSDLGAIPEALQEDVRRALLEFLDLD